MPDSSVLWLAAEGADGRQMFEAELGYQAWTYPRELIGDLRFKMAKYPLVSAGEADDVTEQGFRLLPSPGQVQMKYATQLLDPKSSPSHDEI